MWGRSGSESGGLSHVSANVPILVRIWNPPHPTPPHPTPEACWWIWAQYENYEGNFPGSWLIVSCVSAQVSEIYVIFMSPSAQVSEISSAQVSACPKKTLAGWWFGTFLFSIMYGIILPIDFHIFQDGYCTTNQLGFSAPLSLTKPSVGRACQDFSYTGGTSDSAKTIIFQPSSWLGDSYLTGCATAA